MLVQAVAAQSGGDRRLEQHGYVQSRCAQAPNQKLMACDIHNLTTSGNLQDRLEFEVDASRLTPEVLLDLERRVRAVVDSEHHGHLFDSTFDAFASILRVVDPLKHQVRVHTMPQCSIMTSTALSRPSRSSQGARVLRR